MKTHFDFINDKQVSLLRMTTLLEGRENSEDNINLFNLHHKKSDLDWTIIKQNNLIYPKWVINELQLIKDYYPSIYNEIMSIGINYECS
jgi:hypothetical protein